VATVSSPAIQNFRFPFLLLDFSDSWAMGIRSCRCILLDFSRLANDATLLASSPPPCRKTGSAGIMVQPVTQPPIYFLIRFKKKTLPGEETAPPFFH